MLLQLPFYLGASSAKYKNCLLEENFRQNLIKNLPTHWLKTKQKNYNQLNLITTTRLRRRVDTQQEQKNSRATSRDSKYHGIMEL